MPVSLMPCHSHMAAMMETMTVDDPPSPEPGGASDCRNILNPSVTPKWLVTALMRSMLPSSGSGPPSKGASYLP